ncbi:MAG: acyl dehydratase [Saprospiraceae bacterium]|jgi:acyl dehydratase
MKILHLETIENHIGESFGTSDWQTITQDMINQFADLTGDNQWIHVDTEKAKHSPFGTTVAHGFMVLSFAPKLMTQLIDLQGLRMGLNYGFEKVRFISPVPVNSEVRMSGSLKSVDREGDRVKVTMNIIFELKGNEKPACVAEWVNMFF